MKNIRIEGRRWRDKINGNTYHSARVYVDGELVVAVPWQYGYGDQYVWSGWLALVELLNLDIERHENGSESAWRWCERHGVKVDYDYVDGLKRDMIAWGDWKPEAKGATA